MFSIIYNIEVYKYQKFSIYTSFRELLLQPSKLILVCLLIWSKFPNIVITIQSTLWYLNSPSVDNIAGCVRSVYFAIHQSFEHRSDQQSRFPVSCSRWSHYDHSIVRENFIHLRLVVQNRVVGDPQHLWRGRNGRLAHREDPEQHWVGTWSIEKVFDTVNF